LLKIIWGDVDATAASFVGDQANLENILCREGLRQYEIEGRALRGNQPAANQEHILGEETKKES
jgi:hypothetical protein